MRLPVTTQATTPPIPLSRSGPTSSQSSSPTPTLPATPISSARALLEVRLHAIHFAARETNLFEFRSVDGSLLPEATAGSHIDVHLPNGLVRQYSLASVQPPFANYLIGVKRAPDTRGGSGFMHDRLRVGTVLQISTPRNNFPLVEKASHTVLIAGGIGITPIRAMLERACELGLSCELHYAARTRGDMAFVNELDEMPRVHLHVDEEHANQPMDIAAIVKAAPPDAHLYCCGPSPMLDAFRTATAGGVAEQIHLEHFSAPVDPRLQGGFVVELVRSRKTLSIPEGKSILEVLSASGVAVDYSCEMGICGACETRVLSGTPDHRDSVLSEAAKASNAVMMICCSGSKGGKLVLDL